MHSAQFLGGLQVLPICHTKGKGSISGWENEKTPLKRKFPSYILHTIKVTTLFKNYTSEEQSSYMNLNSKPNNEPNTSDESRNKDKPIND